MPANTLCAGSHFMKLLQWNCQPLFSNNSLTQAKEKWVWERSMRNCHLMQNKGRFSSNWDLFIRISMHLIRGHKCTRVMGPLATIGSKGLEPGLMGNTISVSTAPFLNPWLHFVEWLYSYWAVRSWALTEGRHGSVLSLCAHGQWWEKACIPCCTATDWVASPCLPRPNGRQASRGWHESRSISPPLSCYIKCSQWHGRNENPQLLFYIYLRIKVCLRELFFKSTLLQRPGKLSAERAGKTGRHPNPSCFP